MSECAIGTYRTVLEHLDPDGETASQAPGQGAARAVAAVQEAGGFAAQLAGHRGGIGLSRRRPTRRWCTEPPQGPAVMSSWPGSWSSVATSNDARRRPCWTTPGPITPCAVTSYRCRRPSAAMTSSPGFAFASGNWRRAITDRRHPGMVARRHFEAMVFTYLAGELRTRGYRGDRRRGVRRLAQQLAALVHSASRCWRGSAPRPAWPPRPGSPGSCGMRTWTRPPRWMPGMRTTPTW